MDGALGEEDWAGVEFLDFIVFGFAGAGMFCDFVYRAGRFAAMGGVAAGGMVERERLGLMWAVSPVLKFELV